MASTSSNVGILAHDEIAVVKLPVASGTTLAEGDLIDYSSGDAVAVTASGNTAWVGVAMEGSESGEVFEIAIATRCIISIKVVSTSTDAATPGAAFTWSAGANGTDWQVTSCSAGLAGRMWAIEPIAKGSTGKFKVDSSKMKCGFLFDAIT